MVSLECLSSLMASTTFWCPLCFVSHVLVFFLLSIADISERKRTSTCGVECLCSWLQRNCTFQHIYASGESGLIHSCAFVAVVNDAVAWKSIILNVAEEGGNDINVYV